MTKWMSSGYLRATPAGKVDHERGIIEGVSVCTAGEAKGHGVSLDREFVSAIVDRGNEKRQGLKARFGHPNMCSTALGTFIGRFKNFRQEGDQAKADLFVSNEAKETPHGNLYDYVLGMADNESDMFGTSIVFTPGRYYKRTKAGEKIYDPGWRPDGDETGDEHRQRRQEYRDTEGPEYVECDALHACDAVDEPAANDGLFSQFSQETIAGQITEFLDLNPQVWDAVRSNPEIVAALAQYGDNVDEFISKYREYRDANKEAGKMSDTRTDAETLEETPDASQETPETEDDEATDTEGLNEEAETDSEGSTAESVDEGAETDAQDDTEEAPEETPEQADEDAQDEAPAEDDDTEPASEMSRGDFIAIVDEFGADVAAGVVRDGGGYLEALKLAHKRGQERIEALEAEVKEFRGNAADPVPVVHKDESEKGRLFKTGK